MQLSITHYAQFHVERSKLYLRALLGFGAGGRCNPCALLELVNGEESKGDHDEIDYKEDSNDVIQVDASGL